MRLTLRAMSALLDYPSAELKDHVADIRDALRAEGVLSTAALNGLEPLLMALETEDLLDLQAAYTELFDRSRALSLHLFEHVHGESRERGQAMIDLGQHYVDRGYVIQSSELPDFLPLFLEFLSLLPAAEAREWLAEPVHVLAALEERLSERRSPYAAVFQALTRLAAARPDPEAVARLREQDKADAEKSIDEVWEDTPVDFTTPINAGGPTGVIAKIRAARRAVAAAIKT